MNFEIGNLIRHKDFDILHQNDLEYDFESALYLVVGFSSSVSCVPAGIKCDIYTVLGPEQTHRISARYIENYFEVIS